MGWPNEHARNFNHDEEMDRLKIENLRQATVITELRRQIEEYQTLLDGYRSENGELI